MRSSSLMAAAVVAALGACGPQQNTSSLPPRVAAQHAAIIGGHTDMADPEVFEIEIIGDNNEGASCTGTLIDQHTLITAAHCVDPRTIGATDITLYVMNLTNDQSAGSSDYISVTKMQFHPAWDPDTLANDVGAVLLSEVPIGVTPKQWNKTSISDLTGKTIRAVGYGANLGGTDPSGAGLKREVDLTFRRIDPQIFYLGDLTAKGICHGDSGGPSFYTFPDGVERVVGVHSFTAEDDCLDGADTRVDYVQSFVTDWINANEEPNCGDDGRCATGCATPDIDCLCAADGQCTAMCPDLNRDPDCPPDCGMNQTCSTMPCPVPDPDCVPLGEECSSANLCLSRLCVTDLQHMTPYCTAMCSTDADCSAGDDMFCDPTSSFCSYKTSPLTAMGLACKPVESVCDSGGICAGVSSALAYCSKPCTQDTDCTDSGSTCATSYDGLMYCSEPPKPVVQLPLLSAQGDKASVGCTSAAGVLPLLALLALGRSRRRRT
jgi:MYXO-CTERM domain-containing protein